MSLPVTYRISHRTSYAYTEAVSLCQNLAHLSPRDVSNQICFEGRVTVMPHPAVRANRLDYFGNPTEFFTIQNPHRKLIVDAEHQIAVTPRPLPDPTRSPNWEEVRPLLMSDRSPEVINAAQYVFFSRYVPDHPELRKYAERSFPPGRPILESVFDLTTRIHSEFVYDPRATNVATLLEDVLKNRRGVCQDFAHLEIGCLRSLGLAARYVSGYLVTVPPPGQEKLIGADATHAWLSVYCPGQGWVDVDPTNDQVPTGKHITFAWGRDYDDVSPIKGVILGGGRHTVTVSVDVVPIDQASTSPPASQSEASDEI